MKSLAMVVSRWRSNATATCVQVSSTSSLENDNALTRLPARRPTVKLPLACIMVAEWLVDSSSRASITRCCNAVGLSHMPKLKLVSPALLLATSTSILEAGLSSRALCPLRLRLVCLAWYRIPWLLFPLVSKATLPAARSNSSATSIPCRAGPDEGRANCSNVGPTVTRVWTSVALSALGNTETSSNQPWND